MDKIVGRLQDGVFHCLACAPGRWGVAVYRVNIGIYSQVCAGCHRLVVDGVKQARGGKPLCLFTAQLEGHANG
jgi:hypothetical protein